MPASELELRSIEEDFYVYGVDLARLLGTNETEISRLSRSNVLMRVPDPRKRKSYLYPCLEDARRFIDHYRGKREAIHQKFLQAKAGREQAQQRRIEMLNREREGALVDKAKLVLKLESVIIAYREQLLARSDRFAREIAFAKGLKAKAAKIKAADIDALHVLSDLFKLMDSNGAKDK